MAATSLESHLGSLLSARPALAQTLLHLLQAVADIAEALRSQAVSTAGSANAFGDAQLNVDLAAEKIIRDTVQKKCLAIKTVSSEEEPREQLLDIEHQNDDDTYTLAFDPLDGSSIIDTNWTVGTIMGLWEGGSALNESPASKQVAAILGVHGPRVTAIVALRLPSRGTCASDAKEKVETCFEVALDADGNWGLGRLDIKLDPLTERKTKYFAPANLRAASDDLKYMSLIQHYIQQRYTLRYSGGLVPDILHTLVKGHGVYISPTNDKSKAKLRRLYETLPIALILECCGGAAINPADGRDILEAPVEYEDERSGIICGTKEEVQKAMQFLEITPP